MELTVATNYLGLGEAPKRPGSVSFLKDMDLPAKIKVNCEEMKFDELLPIQREVIPLIRANFDIIGTSPTGTGKTVSCDLVSLFISCRPVSMSRKDWLSYVIVSLEDVL